MKEFKLYLIRNLGILFIIFYSKLAESASIKFTKLECLEFDKPFADFKKCFLKALARDKTSLNIHVRLHDVPVNNVTVNAVLLRKGYTQIYRPHLYNTTFDFCKFLKFQQRYMFWKLVYTVIRKYSNINHTCPFDHDIIIDSLILDVGMMKMIPFPSGDYQFQIKVGAYNHFRAEVRAFLTIYEY